MRLIALLATILLLGALSWLVLDSMETGDEPCPPGRTSTTSPISLPPGIEAAITHC